METKSRLKKLAYVAWGIAIVGTAGINVAHISTQRIHRSRDYCQLPFKALKENHQAVQLLGGNPLKLKNLNLSSAKLSSTEAKLVLPVKGKEETGYIHSMSNRSDKDSPWKLQYAVMRVSRGEKIWNVWLHPDDGIQSNTDLLPTDVQEALV